MFTRPWFLVLCCSSIVGFGCTMPPTDTEAAAPIQQWLLVADDSDALVDVERPELGPYPNAEGIERMVVELWSDGRLCATEGDRHFCGGPLEGIPYRVRGEVAESSLCLEIVDIFGNSVNRTCPGRSAESTTGPDGEFTTNTTNSGACIVASRWNGEPCEICSDENGQIASNTCSPGSSETMVSPVCEPLGLSQEAAGAQLFLDSFNRGLGLLGVPAALPALTQDQLNAARSDADLTSADCSRIESEGGGRSGFDHAIGPDQIENCTQSGSCQIARLKSWAMRVACRMLPPECRSVPATNGIITAAGHAVEATCPGDAQYSAFQPFVQECRGSPLVLDLDGDGVRMSGLDAEVSFALLDHRAVTTGWIAGGDDALLAVDLDGDGEIGSGRELFGEATGGMAADGFVALARHDDNADGRIDHDDAVYSQLLAWRDDGDGISAAAELVPLSELGIESLSLTAADVHIEDEHGNVVGLSGQATGPAGRSVPLLDVWFRFESRN